ncbi:MAG TPA: hypothetical protein PLD88_00760, partial [Candidatus Berkiella sp.]|nr:hypothetical protein [Candidatus Berkiella sp.]
FSLPVKLDESDTFIFNILQAQLTPLGELKYNFHRALSMLFERKPFANLVAEAFNGQPFIVQIVDPACLYSEGDCDYQTKTIRLANNLYLYTLIITLLFELCNAANTNLAKQSYVGCRNAEYLSYARYVNLLPTLRTYLDLISLVHKDGTDFTASIDHEIIGCYPSFAKYWSSVNETHGKEYSHSEYYRRGFRCYQQLLSGIAEYQPYVEPHVEFYTSTEITSLITDVITTTFIPIDFMLRFAKANKQEIEISNRLRDYKAT